MAYYYTARTNKYFKVSGYKKKQFEALKHFKSQFKISENGRSELDMICMYLRLRMPALRTSKIYGKSQKGSGSIQ
jgi:hypothetical protein